MATVMRLLILASLISTPILAYLLYKRLEIILYILAGGCQ